MAGTKDESEKKAVVDEAKAPDTPVELLTAAAEKLEARRGHRNKTWELMAAELRAFAARIEQWEQ